MEKNKFKDWRKEKKKDRDEDVALGYDFFKGCRFRIPYESLRSPIGRTNYNR